MRARIFNPFRSRRFWFLLGAPVAAFVALCTVASVSLLPPSIKSKHLAYYLATTQINVSPYGTIGNADPFANPSQFTGQSILLASILASPELRALIGRGSGIAPRLIALDPPVPSYLPIAAQEPTGGERSTQIVAERDPYRLTIDATQGLPNIGVTAQAPSIALATRIASAAEPALSSYLTTVETSAGTPRAQRLVVRALAPITVASDSYGGLPNVAGFAFMVALVLWSGLVLAVSGVARDVRTLRVRRSGAELGPQVLVGGVVGSMDARRGR